MSRLPFAAIGGQVICDHGPVSLAEARCLALAYRIEAERARGRWRGTCAARAKALAVAIDEAARWRRAAGWRWPDDADRL